MFNSICLILRLAPEQRIAVIICHLHSISLRPFHTFPILFYYPCCLIVWQVELDYPDEYIVSISGYLGQCGCLYFVNSLTFQSNRRVYGPYGSEEGSFFSSPLNIGKIVGFYGRCGMFLDCIGAYFAPTFHLDPIGTVGPYGGKGGRPWDDGRHAGVRQIFISSGQIVDSIRCIYGTAGELDHHGGPGGYSSTVCLKFLAHCCTG